MTTLDDTDLAILRLLAEDGRRPYSAIGDEVGLSGPAVSDRVSRLEEAGVIRGFTVDVDRSQLRAGVPVLVQVDVPTGATDAVRERVGDADAVEHVFVTADGDVVFQGRAVAGDVRRWLDELLGDVVDGDGDDGAEGAERAATVEYDVTLLDAVAWQPSLADASFALSCAECGNTVDEEGESQRFDGDVHHFCCPSCLERFAERYERLDEAA